MTVTVSTKEKGQELVSFGLVESASVNSIIDFTSSKLNENELFSTTEKQDSVNSFICHFIFYAIFCVACVLHILFDLGLASFCKNKLTKLFGTNTKIVVNKKLVFS